MRADLHKLILQEKNTAVLITTVMSPKHKRKKRKSQYPEDAKSSLRTAIKRISRSAV